MQFEPFAIDSYEACFDFIPLTEITCGGGGTQNLDMKIVANNIYTVGGEIGGLHIEAGDYIKLQVVDLDRVYAGILYPEAMPNPVVLKEWFVGWCLFGTPLQSVLLPYSGNPPKDTYLRIVYHRNGFGVENPKVAVNFYLHRRIL